MVLSEGFECVVPSNDAVKGSVINCVGTAPDNYEVFGTVTDWLLVALTALLVLGAFLAWQKAKQTLERMEADAGQADERFFRDMMLRERHEGDRRIDAAMFGLLDAASDLVAATNTSIDDVYDAGMNLRKANLKFVMTFELNKGQGLLEEFCAVLTQVSKSAHVQRESTSINARLLANKGFEHLFQSLLALHRGDIEMPNFLDGLETYVDEIRVKHGLILGTARWLDENGWK